MENVKVTVWLSTYNQAPYVAQALDSILMQKTDFPYEIVAADDCSTDGTQEIILEYQKRYPEKIVTYFTPENIGGCKKLTNCIDLGLFRGDYLSYLEGDDYWLGEDRLQTLVDFLEVHSRYSRVAHQRVLVDENGMEFGLDIPPCLLEREFTIEDFLQGRDYSDFGSLFRNYFRTIGRKYHLILLSSKNVCDFQDMFITQDFGPVYLIKNCFGAYRCKRTAGATNYNSITTPIERSVDHINICKAIEAFYHGQYDLIPFIEKCQRRILTCAIEMRCVITLQKAREYIISEDVNRFLPEILYKCIRCKDWKTIAFIKKQFSSNEKKGLVFHLMLHAWNRLVRRKKLAKDSGIRGYYLGT